ncbi:hypothetical protein JXQ31_12545 [candidate division KSB1 bacterium]|nr:hypothetical protein [candidate division KSB1 bacterium]
MQDSSILKGEPGKTDFYFFYRPPKETTKIRLTFGKKIYTRKVLRDVITQGDRR